MDTVDERETTGEIVAFLQADNEQLRQDRQAMMDTKSHDGRIVMELGVEVSRLREERAAIKDELCAAVDDIVETCVHHNSYQLGVRFRDAVNRAFAKQQS